MRRYERPVILPARPHHKLSNPSGRIRFSLRCLRTKSLIVVIVPTYHNVRPRAVKRIPQRLHR